eukprot:12802702-Alexandrium_andersonii.AAC.1
MCIRDRAGAAWRQGRVAARCWERGVTVGPFALRAGRGLPGQGQGQEGQGHARAAREAPRALHGRPLQGRR